MNKRSNLPRRFLSAAILILVAAGAASIAGAVPSFTEETGNRLVDASPQAIAGDYSTPLRLYFIRDFQVLSATSTDGLLWSEESGVRISSESFNGLAVVFSSVTSADLLPLNTTGYRMVLSVISSTGDYRVITATSSDGVDWGLEGTKFSLPAATFAGSTRLVEETSGAWRLFFVRPFSTGLSSSTYRVFTSTSGDEGATWGPATQVFTPEAHAIALSVRTDGRLRMFYTAPLTNNTTATQILSALESGIGGTLSFNAEAGVRVSTGATSGVIGDILAFRDIEPFRWRVYHEFLATATASVPIVASSLSGPPDPQRLSPPAVVNSSPASAFTITGEIFSSTVTAKLTKSGETDITGTSLSRSDDQTISVVFDTLGASLGLWTLVVENGDAQTGTIVNALEVTFAAGVVSRLDNVFRPLTGQKVHFDVTVFNDGPLTIKIFTLDGRLLRTLFNGPAASGTTGIDWDARTDDGNLVASGVYVVNFEGPNLETREKIVVIK